MPFKILIQELAANEIESLRSYDQRRLLDEIELQLSHQPDVSTRRRKCLVGLAPEFEHVQPVWELRVGQFRVFYDIDASSSTVYLRAVRRKEPENRTKDIT